LAWPHSEVAVTGVIGGSLPPDVTIHLEQDGPRVKGSFELRGGAGFGRYSGFLEGRVGGDVLHFTVVGGTRDIFTGELTVKGEEMEGTFRGANVNNARIIVHRVDFSSGPKTERP
jgi:hypothetical protein